ncbi:MAG: class I SAM-dependent methyltransferase [Candidatus Kerfeldbacteria bacterium]
MKSLHRKILDAYVHDHRHYLKGKVLNVGGGSKTYRELANEMVVMDYYDKNPSGTQIHADVVADAQKEFPFPDELFDAVICTQLLEHLPEPQFTVNQICRVLKPGGYLLLSVPFLERYHADPDDYQRFTHRGIEWMLRDKFSIETIKPLGGRAVNIHYFLQMHGVPEILLKAGEPVTRWLSGKEKNPQKWTVGFFSVAKKK